MQSLHEAISMNNEVKDKLARIMNYLKDESVFILITYLNSSSQKIENTIQMMN